MALSTPAGCAVDGIFYVIGGHNRSFQQQATVFAYDPRTDSWAHKKDMPTPRRWLSVAVVDGVIYAIGGGGWRDPVLKTVEAYDPKTDTWTTRAPMPTGRFTFAACAVDGIIYALGGGDNNMDGLSTVEAYDPKTDHWTSRHPMPKAIGMLTAETVGGRIYACKGKEVFTYNPPTDQWTTQVRFSTYRQASLSGTKDGLIYLCGGCSDDYWTAYDLVTAFDPVRGAVVAKRRMPRTRGFGASAMIDGKIYLAGGVSQEPVLNPDAVFYEILDVFDPLGGVTPEFQSAAVEASDRLRLTWRGEAGTPYGVRSTSDVAQGAWTSNMFAAGGATLVATNTLVEATIVVSPTNTTRFFRVIDASCGPGT